MGYHTDFEGSVTVTPPLNEDEISFLNDFSTTRRMERANGPLFVKGTGAFGQGNDDDIRNFNGPPEGQPGLWCQWVPGLGPDYKNDNGAEIQWDGNEKFYNATDWMEYLITHLFGSDARAFVDAHKGEDKRLANFTCDHVLNGTINAFGEESGDIWRIVVDANTVTSQSGSITFKEN